MRRSTARSPLETLPGSTARPQRPMSPTTGAFLLSLLLAPLAALHQDGDAQEPRDEPGVRRSAGNEGGQEETLLHDFMESLDTVVFDIEDALFEPGAEPSAEDWARHVEAVVALQGSGLAAKGELPRTVQGLSGPQRAKRRVAYTHMMHELLQALFALELTLLQQDRAAYRRAVIALEELESKGHEAFKPRRRRR